MIGKRWMGAALALAIGLTGMQGTHALAATYYPSGSSGYDVSYPNGTALPTGSYAFGIVGVTGGRAFTNNSYLAGQFVWAKSGTGAAPSLYMNLNAPVGSTASEGQSGPYGSKCKRSAACFAENYGWNSAEAAATYATSKGASSSMWWLDIETSNSWSRKTTVNRNVITGAMAYLQSLGATVGIYSTASMWNKITGSWNSLGAPVWLAGGPISNQNNYCASTSFTGGAVSLVQNPSNNFDADYAC